MQTILSPNRTVVTGAPRKKRVVVVHDMEYPERMDAAEEVGRYFQKPATRASAHICADANSLVRCVPDKDVAWAAPGANHDGLQIELAGYAKQSARDWNDDYSHAMLVLAARQVAAWCDRYDLPIRYLTAADLLAGKAGITTHRQVTAAYHESTHTDPGPNFPMTAFLAQVRGSLLPTVSAADIREAWAHDSFTRHRAAHPVQVKRVQRALGIHATGFYGAATRRAVTKRFPAADHGLLTYGRLQRLAQGRFAVEE